MAECRDIHHIRIFRVNGDASDMVRRFESHFLPGLPAIERFIHSVAPRRTLTVILLTRADPHDGGIGRRDLDVADRRDVFLVEDRFEGCSVVRGLPNSAGRRADIDDVGVVLDHGERVDAAAHHCRADLAELEILQLVGRIRLVRRGNGSRPAGARQKEGQKPPESTRTAKHDRPPLHARAGILPLPRPRRIICFWKGSWLPAFQQTRAADAALRRSCRATIGSPYTSSKLHARLAHCFYGLHVSREPVC